MAGFGQVTTNPTLATPNIKSPSWGQREQLRERWEVQLPEVDVVLCGSCPGHPPLGVLLPRLADAADITCSHRSPIIASQRCPVVRGHPWPIETFRHQRARRRCTSPDAVMARPRGIACERGETRVANTATTSAARDPTATEPFMTPSAYAPFKAFLRSQGTPSRKVSGHHTTEPRPSLDRLDRFPQALINLAIQAGPLPVHPPASIDDHTGA